MKNLALAVGLLFAFLPSAFAGVTVTSPTSGTTVSSPVHVVASATSSHPITFMRIYVDYTSVYGVAASSVNTYVTLASGGHNMTVQAWDSTGAVFKSSLTITVQSGSGIPSTATVFSQIEDMTGWQNCDSCAGAGGTGPTAPHWMAQYQTTPSLDGSSAEFFLGGSTAYSNALWWKQLGAIDSVTHFVYDLNFYFVNASAPQALEFDVNQSVNSHKYIFGTECDFTGVKHWKTWDYYLHWQDTGIPCTALTAKVWHHLVWEFERTSGGKTHFIAVTVDGVRTSINRYYNPAPSSVRELNVAFQMDGNKYMTDYNVWLDKVKLSVW